MEKRQVTKKAEMQTMDIILVGILLAAGAVLRLAVPQIGGITPNFIITMYVIVILMIKPTLKETLGIALISAVICQLTTKSAIPYVNFISEPIGAVIAYLFTQLPVQFEVKKISFRPAIVSFLSTLASGLTYVVVFKSVYLFGGDIPFKALSALLSVVIVTAVANTVVAQVLYYPIAIATGKMEAKSQEETL